MWIIDFPSTLPSTHLLYESKEYIIGRSDRSQFHSDIKKVSKVQFILSFSDHNLLLNNHGKGRFDLNGDFLPNGQKYQFKKTDTEAKDLRFSFRSQHFEFRIYYLPFIINDRPCAEELVSKGFPAESSQLSNLSHYIIEPDDNLNTIIELCRNNQDIQILTRDTIERILSHIDDLATDFTKYWPIQAAITIYVEDGDEDAIYLENAFKPTSNIEIKIISKDKVNTLPSNCVLWSKHGKIEGFEGLIVSGSSLVFDVLKKNLEKRSIKRSTAISGLATMMDFGMDDFTVIKTQGGEEQGEEEQSLSPDGPPASSSRHDLVADSQSEDDEQPASVLPPPEKLIDNHSVSPSPTKFLKIDVSKLDEIQGPATGSDSPKDRSSASADLVRAFQEAKKIKEINAERDQSPNGETVKCKVTKFKLTEVKLRSGPRVYESTAAGLYSDERWNNRVDYSRFRKKTFVDGNPITDSTMKGIQMKKSNYRSDNLGQITSQAEDELMDFNAGIGEVDREFEVPSRKRKETALFVEDDQDDNDDFEPSFHSRHREEEDDVPTFKRRARR
ncbi:DEKNAAC103849 [Brettanomyces naardenensis]|uniref:DEKNAAC103849 n=1 Tax=Brettanomyces naardenensis TaxID=13370 RepID=A0A448YPB8_BRENA|nr:DEKNAAC103849 [Brettanomyces naardenensis]